MPTIKPTMTGIEELRAAVAFFDTCRESFNMATGDKDRDWTAEQLLKLWRAMRASGWDISPDQWTDKQLKQALRGIAPDFRQPTHVERALNLRAADTVPLIDGYVPVYPSQKGSTEP